MDNSNFLTEATGYDYAVALLAGFTGNVVPHVINYYQTTQTVPPMRALADIYRNEKMGPVDVDIAAGALVYLYLRDTDMWKRFLLSAGTSFLVKYILKK